MSFELIYFRNCNLGDPFFDSLKEDYPAFDTWFKQKSEEGAQAYVDIGEDNKIHAFLAIKSKLETDEPIGMTTVSSSDRRMKLSTLKIDDLVKRSRLGEGAVGIALWTWQNSDAQQIYLTTYPKQIELIALLERFGFKHVSDQENGEQIYLRDKRDIDYSDCRKAFPYINPDFPKAKYLPILDTYHDVMFQRSNLRGVMKKDLELPVSNGITKIFIATPYSLEGFDYSEGDLVFVYRIHDGEGKGYKSVVTSYCTVSKVIPVKKEGAPQITFDEYREKVGNKSVYSDEVIESEYEKKNVFLIELIYNGYFGEGNNINWHTLKNAGLWSGYPYSSHLTKSDVKKIFSMGNVDVQYLNLD